MDFDISFRVQDIAAIAVLVIVVAAVVLDLARTKAH